MLLKEYFAALWSVWWPLMSCAIFTFLSIATGIASNQPKWEKWVKDWEWKTSLIAALFFFFVSGYFAWKEEYLQTHPGLRVYIVAIDVGEKQETGGVAIMLLGNVSNLGTPTIADNWHLQIVSPRGEQLFDGPASAIIDGKPFTFSAGSPIETQFLDPRDALYKKTVAPLERGSKVSGFLVFEIADTLKQETIRALGTRLVLHCKDVYGNDIHGEIVMSGKQGASRWPYVPGISVPSSEPPK